MNQERLYYLLDKYAAENLSAKEHAELGEFIQSGPDRELFMEAGEKYLLDNQNQPLETSIFEGIPGNILMIDQYIKPSLQPVRRLDILKKWSWAAAIILLTGTGAYLWNSQKINNASEITKTPGKIATGGNKALLTLADGSTVVLDSAGNGMIAKQGNTLVVKMANGQIVYNLKGAATDKVMINTVTTPKGGQYQVVLPDETKVWLNAASSVTYPVVFTGDRRDVKVTGEAYFEVATDKQKPFMVNVEGMSSIEVLGTDFNINSYQGEENIKTTLLNGSIKVKILNGGDKEKAVVLKPHQQAIIPLSGTQPLKTFTAIQVSNNVDTDKVIAWKNGLFNFDGADLRTVMSQLARWYNIEVKYEGKIPNLEFEGELSRDLQLAQIIKILDKVEVKFRLQGNSLIVSGN